MAFAKPKAIVAEDLSPAGQQALSLLQNLLAGVPDGKLKGSFGTINVK